MHGKVSISFRSVRSVYSISLSKIFSETKRRRLRHKASLPTTQRLYTYDKRLKIIEPWYNDCAVFASIQIIYQPSLSHLLEIPRFEMRLI